jgi:glycosyltransferase involved in cell wall biosynthesis
MNQLISIVTGTRNEEGNIREWYERIKKIIQKNPKYIYEIIVIDNDSTDGCQSILREIASQDPTFRVILNSRNFGHIRSPYHALVQAGGDAVIFLASDLQDPPEMIPQLIDEWKKGAKAIVCVKESSEESPVFFLIRRLYYALIGKLSETQLIKNFTGFGLYDRAIVDYCRKVDDPYPYFRGQISEIGLPIKEISYRQPFRKHGITKNNFFTLYDLAMLGITNHSKVPLRLATLSGFLLSILSFLVGMGYLVYKLLFWERFTLGIAPALIGIFFFCSVILFFIGILGEYIGAIHTQVLRRPLVVEKERINF